MEELFRLFVFSEGARLESRVESLTGCESTILNANSSSAPLKVEASVLMQVGLEGSKEVISCYQLLLMAKNICQCTYHMNKFVP